MPSFTILRELQAPFATVWEIFDDFGNTHRSHPLVKASRIVKGPARGLGATRRCDLYKGKHFAVERITDYVPERRLTIDVVEGSFPLKAFTVTIKAKETRPGRTGVKLIGEFTPKMAC